MVKASLTTKRLFAPSVMLQAVAIIFCVAGANAVGQTTSSQLVPAALPPELIEIRSVGNEALYNLDYSTAREKFTELRDRLPQHPAGDLNLAALIWMEHLYKTRRLQTTLYTQEGFYAGGTKSKEGDPIEAGVDKAFRDRIAQAKAKAQKLVDRAPNDPDALYFLGAVYGVLAGYEASAGRKFMSALRNGSRCRELHQRAVKFRPDAYDTYLSIGLYDYVVGSLPGFVRFMVGFIGIHGNKEQGVRELRMAAEKGLYNQDDAAVMLLAVYQREGKPQEALPILEKLSAKYQRNYLIRLEMASTLNRLGRAGDAGAIFEALLQDKSANAEDLIRYQYGEALAVNREYRRAAEQFIAVTKAAVADPDLVTWAFLRAGQALDLGGYRNEAIEQYRKVLARPNIYDSRDQASRGLKKPFREKEDQDESGIP
jgi:tetratricopeptide (TPR) repeat protein